jgi:hypothetical protein
VTIIDTLMASVGAVYSSILELIMLGARF